MYEKQAKKIEEINPNIITFPTSNVSYTSIFNTTIPREISKEEIISKLNEVIRELNSRES